MIKIEYDRRFKKNFQNRIIPHKKILKRFKDRLELFVQNPRNPILKDHKLKGAEKEYRAFSITGDIRIIYIKYNNTVALLDIGTHAQVY